MVIGVLHLHFQALERNEEKGARVWRPNKREVWRDTKQYVMYMYCYPVTKIHG